MRKLIVLSCVFLILSGILLAYPGIFPWAEESTAVSLLHIWAGIFFIVIFPLYSWDHIKGHSERLKKISLVTLTGLLQFFAGGEEQGLYSFAFSLSQICLLKIGYLP